MLAELGKSRNDAIKIFLNTKQRLERNIALRGAYIELNFFVLENGRSYITKYHSDIRLSFSVLLLYCLFSLSFPNSMLFPHIYIQVLT